MYQVVKRFFDFVSSLLALVVLSPLLLPICIGLLFTGEHYIFYRQNRIGKGAKYFDIFKFATMLKDSPNMGTGMITLRNDPRVTPMGGFLRKTKINELPQLLNILIGDMSVVGPRPTVRKHAEAYDEVTRNKIYSIKPGLTGVGSIVFRDEEELISQSGMQPYEFYKKHIIPYKAAVELWYQDNLSFFTDLKIIFLTAWAIVFPKSDLHTRLLKGLPELPEELKVK